MISGRVIFYNSERRFGYVEQGGSHPHVRILGSALVRAGIQRLSEGQKVKYDTHIDPDSGKITVNNIEIDCAIEPKI